MSGYGILLLSLLWLPTALSKTWIPYYALKGPYNWPLPVPLTLFPAIFSLTHYIFSGLLSVPQIYRALRRVCTHAIFSAWNILSQLPTPTYLRLSHPSRCGILDHSKSVPTPSYCLLSCLFPLQNLSQCCYILCDYLFIIYLPK